MDPFSAKMTSKGQITLPAKLRKHLGVKAGDRIDFVEAGEGKIEIVPRKKRLADLRGIIPYDGPPLSTADLARMVGEARSGRADSRLGSLGKQRR